METADLVRMFGGHGDSDHHLGCGDKGGDQFAAAESALLRHGKRRRENRGAGMHADTWFAAAVKLEGMRQRTVGEGRHLRLHLRPALPKDAALATRAVGCRVVD